MHMDRYRKIGESRNVCLLWMKGVTNRMQKLSTSSESLE